MFRIGGAHAGFEKLTLADAFPLRLANEDADVTLCDVRFTCDALGWKRDVEYAEIYGDRRARQWSIEAAQSRAKDEVLAALFLVQRAEKSSQKLEEYVSSFRKKNVLVLGSYQPHGKSRLLSISKALRKAGTNLS